MRNSGEAADILQAAMDNDEVIDTSWGPVGPRALRKRLMVLDAELMAQQLDEQTQAAQGKPRGSRI
jgi:hypothetical protein